MGKQREQAPVWLRHDGGPNPAIGQTVDLVCGFGVMERQPSDQVNWFFHWEWRLTTAQPTV